MIAELIQHINELSGQNQFIGAAIAMWLLGVFTLIAKGVPNAVSAIIKKQFTTTLTITSYHDVFHDVAAWLNSNGYSEKVRSIKLTNGLYGNKDAAYKSMGYGRHLFWYRRCPMTVELIKEQTDRNEDKETITFKKLGRRHRILDALIQDIKTNVKREADKFKVYVWQDHYWSESDGLQPKRPMDSIYLDHAIKDKLVTGVEKFMASEKFYAEHGIPYHLGILLHGPPGTGKTSLAKALVSYLDRDIYILSSADLMQLGEAARRLKDNAIMLVEDFDAFSATADRGDDDNSAEAKLIKAFGGSGLSVLLNEMDGVSSTHGRIAVFTTNHKDKLDPAVLRPGRIDLSLEIGYVTCESMDMFLDKFFGKGLGDDYTLNSDTITPAELQNKALAGKGHDYFIETYCRKALT